ncbi:ATP/GTP-binding protein [Sanguibacter gelidistatuariae]|uniref:ATP/GTP-binding protein n=1 Tax=Sanguibacter gelidistatuariae TaxID=1814289 RepID=UPI0011137714|nr:ATP/GTP-binding protein [Sanguibacter gelidistatuariae]
MPNSTRSMPCSSDLWGSFNNADGCYYLRLDPPPNASHPIWSGDSPEGRSVYQRECMLAGGGSSNYGWAVLDDAVAAPAITATPAQVALQAIAQMTLLGPDIAMAPPTDRLGLVGIPVWMWTDATTATWGPVTATASVTGVSVTATASASKIVWDMGDGHTVTCRGPGTPYGGGAFTDSPDCGYVYPRSSAGQPGDAYTVTATTTWDITWVGGGQSGSLTTTRDSTTQLQIGELQVLNQ